MKALFALLFFFHAAIAFAQTTNDTSVRFQTIDIFVNSGETPLAAYQLEFKAASGNVKIVGIEGGEHAAFKDAPYYDPKAMQQERVIIAAFSTNSDLPTGKTRVATVHVQITGSQSPTYTVKLQASADSAGRKISAQAEFAERKNP